MSKRGLLLVGAALFAAAAGCESPALKPVHSQNTQVPVELLTTFDDCAVYRFYDDGEPIYIARCGADASASWQHKVVTGKAVLDEPRQTLTVKR